MTFMRRYARKQACSLLGRSSCPPVCWATRRGDFVFMQNCNDHSVDIDGVELEKYSTRLVQLEPVDEDDES